MAHSYDTKFMQYTAGSSQHAAQRVTALVQEHLSVSSVLDVGCAHGTWLKSWVDQGVGDVQGVDGDYVDVTHLEIPAEHFSPRDLNKPFDLDRKFDLVQSLEVGEHINPASADDFAQSIAAHAQRFILFSAAPPGQGGEFHINEESYEAWRHRFAAHGFEAFDWVRAQIQTDTGISYWYRYNIFLFVHRDQISYLPENIKRCLVAQDTPLPDISPPLFRLRKAVVRKLPGKIQHEVARMKARFLPTGRF